jgi:hypothetical protein
LITVSEDPQKALIVEDLQGELAKLADVRFTKAAEGSDVADITIDILVSPFPGGEGIVLDVNSEVGGLFTLRAMMLDKEVHIPDSPYRARKVLRRAQIPAVCAEIAAGLDDSIFERYLQKKKASVR